MRVQVEWMPLKKKKLPQYCGSFFFEALGFSLLSMVRLQSK